MPLLWLLPLVVSAAPIRLASVGFKQVGLTDAQAAYYASHFALKLNEDPGLRVVTQEDMATMLGIERQRQLLGCSDSAESCMAELAGALGADAVIVGRVAHVGDRYQLDVKVLANAGTRTLFQHSSPLLASEEALLADVTAAASEAATALEGALRGGVRSPVKLVPAALGVGSVAVGAAFWISAALQYARLADRSGWDVLGQPSAEALRDTGQRNQTIGIALVACGAAAIAAGVAWYALTPSAPVVSVAPVPGGGGGLVVGGALP